MLYIFCISLVLEVLRSSKFVSSNFVLVASWPNIGEILEFMSQRCLKNYQVRNLQKY